MTAGVPWIAEEGNVPSYANKACEPGADGTARHVVGKTRPSLGPGTWLCRSLGLPRRKASGTTPRRKAGRSAHRTASTPGKPALQEEPGAGRAEADGSQLAARHRRSRERSPACRVRTGTEVAASFSYARIRRARRGPCPYVVSRCRSRQAASWSRISPCSEPPKRGAAGVNGDLARFGRLRSREGPWVEGSSERMVVIQTAPWNQGAGLVMSQGGVRTPLSGPSIARAVGGSRARGTLSLERGSATGSHEGLPDDGRHPGSQRADRVHARSVPVTSAAPLPESRPTAR